MPADLPVTIPLAASMVATAVVALLQVPPLGVLESVLVVPWQIVVVPVMALETGNALTESDWLLNTVPPHPPVMV